MLIHVQITIRREQKKYTYPFTYTYVCVLYRWGMCVLHALEDLQNHLQDVALPMLTIQGDSDKLCEKSGAEKLHRMASSQDKKLSVSITNHQSETIPCKDHVSR